MRDDISNPRDDIFFGEMTPQHDAMADRNCEMELRDCEMTSQGCEMKLQLKEMELQTKEMANRNCEKNEESNFISLPELPVCFL